MSEIFAPAIAEMERQQVQYSEPRSFQDYLQTHNITGKKTASLISVQTWSQLNPDLRQKEYMVFRLGSRPEAKRCTYFALAKLSAPDVWSEYFLLDDLLFADLQPQLFLPNVSIRQLFAFNLLSSLTENSLINLAISSGLLAKALDIETSESLAAPASGQGTATFEFKPHPDAPVWLHCNGQVEIDALFIGKRQGQETLFVIESKTSEKFDSLAKYKLVYPVLALQKRVPDYIPIVPVYLRTIKSSTNREVSFYIAECTAIDRASAPLAISTLEVVQAKHLVLFGYNDSYGI